MTNRQWRVVLGAIGVGIAIVLGQTDVPLDPVFKLILVVAAGVIAFVKAPDETPEA